MLARQAGIDREGAGRIIGAIDELISRSHG
jgi:hypothetical protein